VELPPKGGSCLIDMLCATTAAIAAFVEAMKIMARTGCFLRHFSAIQIVAAVLPALTARNAAGLPTTPRITGLAS